MATPKKKVTSKDTVKKSKPFDFTSDKILTDSERSDLIDSLTDSSSLLNDVRMFTMNRSRVEIPRMSISSKIVPDGEDPAPIKPEFSTIVLVSSRLVLPWTVTNEFLQDNPDVEATESRILKIMAIQAANDITDLLINGNESSSDKLLRANDGILALATENVSLESGYKKRDVTSMFSELVRALPTKYRSRPEKLQLIVSPNTWMDYVEEIVNVKNGQSNAFLKSLSSNPTYNDIAVRAEPFMPDDKIILTDPENIVFGLEKELKLRKTNDGASAIKFNETYYALYMRMDIAIQNPDALIVGTIEPVKIRRIAKFASKVNGWLKRVYATLVRRPLHFIAKQLLKV